MQPEKNQTSSVSQNQHSLCELVDKENGTVSMGTGDFIISESLQLRAGWNQAAS